MNKQLTKKNESDIICNYHDLNCEGDLGMCYQCGSLVCKYHANHIHYCCNMKEIENQQKNGQETYNDQFNMNIQSDNESDRQDQSDEMEP